MAHLRYSGQVCFHGVLQLSVNHISSTADSDRLSAMTFGRPTMLSRSCSVPIPLLIDDEYLSDQKEGNQPPDIPSRLGLFVSSCKLFEILHEILVSFYAEDAGTSTSKQTDSNTVAQAMIADVLRHNRSLAMFEDSIPDYLRTTGSSYIIISEESRCVNLQQQVLYCRYARFPGSSMLLRQLTIPGSYILSCCYCDHYSSWLPSASHRGHFKPR